MNNLIKYNVTVRQISVGQTVQSNCNEITFINTGTNIVNIELIQLQPGQQFKIGGNLGELCVTSFNVSFVTGTGINSLIVVQKIYAE